MQALNLAESEAGHEAIGLWFFRGCEKLICGHEGCDELIPCLSADYRLGIVTNGDYGIQRRKFEALGLSEHFQAFVASDAVGHQKPEPEISTTPSRSSLSSLTRRSLLATIFSSTFVARSSAGMRGIWFNPRGSEAQDGIVPDAAIRALADLPPLLARF